MRLYLWCVVGRVGLQKPVADFRVKCTKNAFVPNRRKWEKHTGGGRIHRRDR